MSPRPRNVSSESTPDKGIGLRSAAWILTALLGVACGADEAPPSAPPAKRPVPAFRLPDAPATPEERIDRYLAAAVSGDPEEAAWAAAQMARAGEAARTRWAGAFRSAVADDAEKAEGLLKVVEQEGAPLPSVNQLAPAALSTDGRVRLLVARLLGRSTDAAAVPVLVDLCGDGISAVAAEALGALSRLGSPEGARALRGRFPNGLNPSRELRRRVVAFVARVLPVAESGPFLTSIVDGEDAVLALQAARELLRFGDGAALEDVTRRFGRTADGRLRLPVLEVMAEARMPEALPPLLEMAKSPDPESAVGAVAALGLWGDGAARAALRKLASEGAPLVRREALHALIRRRDSEAGGVVKRMLRGGGEERGLATTLIASARATDLGAALAAACEREKEPSLRREMASALSQLRVAAGARAIALVLVSEGEDDASLALTAHSAAQALLRLPEIPADARRILFGAGLGSPSAAVRQNAARVIGAVARGEAERAALEALFTDPSPGVRSAAAAGWAENPEGTLGPVLRALDAETDPETVRALQSAARMVYYRWQS